MALAHAQLAHVAQVRVRRVRPRPASDEGWPATREANARARVRRSRTGVQLKDKWRNVMRTALSPVLYKKREATEIPENMLEDIRSLATAKEKETLATNNAMEAKLTNTTHTAAITSPSTSGDGNDSNSNEDGEDGEEGAIGVDERRGVGERRAGRREARRRENDDDDDDDDEF